MLQQFSWQQFLVAATVLAIVWCCSIILLYYRKELKKLFNGEPLNEDQPLGHRWDKQVDNFDPDADSNSLMGEAKLPDGVSIMDMEELQFSDPDPKIDKLGLIPDVITEISNFFELLGQLDGNKPEFMIMLETLKEQYPKISGSPNLLQINDFIIENAPFHISMEELENFW